MSAVYHIGIPKSGTTTVQKVLREDKRIILTRSRFLSSSDWWTTKKNVFDKNAIVIESNETLISVGFQKVKFIQVIERIYNLNKDAKIIITIREQKQAILSMYKYHIKNNYVGTSSLENWLYNTDLGLDFISICMYGNILKALMSYFPKENISFLFFEELKEDPDSFYKKFYKILGIEQPKSKALSKTPLNVNHFSNDQLYTLSRINKFSLTRVNPYKKNSFAKIRRIEQKLKNTCVKYLYMRSKHDFFNINNIKGYEKLEEDLKRTNHMLLQLGLVEHEELKKYNYIL